jgi:hypothetical protein
MRETRCLTVRYAAERSAVKRDSPRSPTEIGFIGLRDVATFGNAESRLRYALGERAWPILIREFHIVNNRENDNLGLTSHKATEKLS